MSFCSLNLGEDDGSGLSQPSGDAPGSAAPLTHTVSAPLPEGEGVSVTYEGGKH